MKVVGFCFLLLIVTGRNLHACKCAKDCGKNVCKGKWLYKADEKLARGAGVNVGDPLCISHRDEAKRANSRCSYPSSPGTVHSKVLVDIPNSQ